MEVVRTVRRIRAEYGLTKQKPKMALRIVNPQTAEYIKEYLPTIIFLCSSADDVKILGEGGIPEGDSNVTVIVPGTPIEAFLDLEGMIDFDKEIGTLEKKIVNLDKVIASIKKKQSESTYSSKVPEAIQADDTLKLQTSEDERSKAAMAIQNMRDIQGRKKK